MFGGGGPVEGRAKKRKPTKPSGERCGPLSDKTRLRLASDAQTASIKENFPRGVAQPALRALFAAGLTTLDQLAQLSEQEISSLHGMGPKAVATLRAALKVKGLGFRSSVSVSGR